MNTVLFLFPFRSRLEVVHCNTLRRRSVEQCRLMADLAFLTLLCGLRYYFSGEKSVDRMYVRSIFSTSLLGACSDLIAC